MADDNALDGKAQAQRLTRALAYVREVNNDPDYPIQYLLTLLRAAAEPGLTVSQHSQALGGAQGSMSRIINNLSAYVKYSQPGPGLVEAVQDPLVRNRKRVFLTQEGRQQVETILSIVAGENVSLETQTAQDYLASFTGPRRGGEHDLPD